MKKMTPLLITALLGLSYTGTSAADSHDDQHHHKKHHQQHKKDNKNMDKQHHDEMKKDDAAQPQALNHDTEQLAQDNTADGKKKEKMAPQQKPTDGSKKMDDKPATSPAHSGY